MFGAIVISVVTSVVASVVTSVLTSVVTSAGGFSGYISQLFDGISAGIILTIWDQKHVETDYTFSRWVQFPQYIWSL